MGQSAATPLSGASTPAVVIDTKGSTSAEPNGCDDAGVTLRIAAVQAEPVVGAVAHNLSKAAALTRAAASHGVEVVVLPEAFTTGYDDEVFAGSLPSADDLRWLGPIREAVDETGVLVVLNTALDRGDRRTLTDVIVVPGGPPVVAYDKQHLYESERRVFTPGDRGFSFTKNGVELALSVCYDANFPEHAAAAATAGAIVYVNSGAYFPGGEHRRDLHYAARALDNGVFVVFSGLVGGAQGFIGGSAVFDPTGRRIAHVSGLEGMAIADIDPAVVDRVRRDQRMWADRRSDLGGHARHGEVSPTTMSGGESSGEPGSITLPRGARSSR